MQLLPLETDLRTAARLARNVVRQRLGRNGMLASDAVIRHPRFVRGAANCFEDFDEFFGAAPRVGCTLDRRFHIGVQADGTVSGCCPVWVPIGSLIEQPLEAVPSRKLESRQGCFGCHRLDVHVALERAGERA